MLGGSESRSPVASQMASGVGDAWKLPPSRVWHMGRVQHPGLEQWGLCGPPFSLPPWVSLPGLQHDSLRVAWSFPTEAMREHAGPIPFYN